MKNKNGFGKIEILISIMMIMIVSYIIITSFMENSKKIRYISMRQSASNFTYAVVTNIASFSNHFNVYLQEVIDENLLEKIKNPISGGSCDSKESKIEYIDNKPYVTLKCGNYLIDKEKITANFNVTIYKISDWNKNIPDSGNYEKKELYTCLNNNKYNDYYEELYFLYMINKDYNKKYTSINEIDSNICKYKKNEYYRSKNIIDDF